MMQSDNNVRYIMLFCRMKNTGRNIQVKTHYGFRLYIRFCHYLSGPFQRMFPLKFLFQWIVIVIYNIKSDKTVFIFFIP